MTSAAEFANLACLRREFAARRKRDRDLPLNYIRQQTCGYKLGHQLVEARTTSLSKRVRAPLADQLHIEIREKIRSGRLTAGQRLPTERELIETYNVSRTTVREAIARLAADGLVQARQGLGVFVTEAAKYKDFVVSSEELNTLSEVGKLLELRLGVETEMVGLAAERRSADDIRCLRECLRKIRGAPDQESSAAADAELHQAIARASHNQYFERILAFIGSRLVPPRSLVAPAWSATEATAYAKRLDEEHTAVVDAIAAGNPDRAREKLRLHLGGSIRRHVDAMHSH